jgi:hypothetical protein
MKLRHICEVCGKEEILTPEEAFDAGWDYPPKMGKFGVLSPRTCDECLVMNTLWWKITCTKLNLNGSVELNLDEFSEDEKKTLIRILNEPESILVEE